MSLPWQTLPVRLGSQGLLKALAWICLQSDRSLGSSGAERLGLRHGHALSSAKEELEETDKSSQDLGPTAPLE